LEINAFESENIHELIQKTWDVIHSAL